MPEMRSASKAERVGRKRPREVRARPRTPSPRVAEEQRGLRLSRAAGVCAAALLALLGLTALLAPVVSPEGYASYNPGASNRAPHLALPGTHDWRYIMGADSQGHSILMWVTYGGRTSLALALVSALLAAFLGGLGAATLLGRGQRASLVRNAAMTVGRIPYLLLLCIVLSDGLAARPPADAVLFGVLGALTQLRPSRWRAMAVAARVLRLLSWFLLLQGTLDFLGLGLRAPEVSWGRAMHGSVDYMPWGNWWWPFFPGLALSCAALASTALAGLLDSGEPGDR